VETPPATTSTWTDIETIADLKFSGIGPDRVTVESCTTLSNLTAGDSGLYLENTDKNTNSGWRQDNNSWTSTGLSPNKLYIFASRSRNGLREPRFGATREVWTLAATPAAPTVGSPTATTLGVAVGTGDGNPAGTPYAISCDTTGQWVQTDGSLGASAVWQTAAAWGTTTVTGLSDHSSYSFSARARNGESVETANGPAAGGTTSDAVPTAPNQPGVQSVGTDQITWRWSDNSDNETHFDLWCGPGAAAPTGAPTCTASAGATSALDTGYSPNAQYAFQVAARRHTAQSAKTDNYTTWTLAEVPKAPVLAWAAGGKTRVTIRLPDGNPGWTEYAIRVWLYPGGNQWVQASGALGPNPVWQTASEWGAIVTETRPVLADSPISFWVRVRNGAGLETAFGPAASLTAAGYWREYE